MTTDTAILDTPTTVAPVEDYKVTAAGKKLAATMKDRPVRWFSLNPNGRNAIIFDVRYYNTLEVGRKDRIRDNWDPDQVGVGMVNIRADHTIAGLDAMHRTTAARELGIPELRYIVYEGLSLAEEAFMYRFQNNRGNRRLPSPKQEFRPSIVEGDRHAIAMDKILKEHSYTIEGRGDNFISGFGHVRKAYDLDEGESLNLALKAAREAWPTGRLTGLMTYTLTVIFHRCRPAYRTLVHVLRYMTPDLKKTPACIGPDDWVATVRRGQFIGVNTRYMPFLLVREILTRANKGKSSHAMSLAVLDDKSLVSAPPTV